MRGGLRVLTAFLILFIGVVGLVYAEVPVPTIPRSVGSVRSSRKPKLLLSKTRSRGTRSSIATATWKTRTILTPSSTSNRNSATHAPSSTPFPDATRSMPGSRNCWRLAPSEAPQMGGKYYFHTRREGNQNQPMLYVREGPNGALNDQNRVLLDVNKLASDGTIALDWWYASEMASTSRMGLRQAVPRSAPSM